MKETMPKTKTVFAVTALSAVVALFALVAATCEEAQTAQTLPEAQNIETAQTENPETDETPAEEDPVPVDEAGVPFERLPEAIYLPNVQSTFDPITEIEMVFVEGGSMLIQGQKITLDSFWISRFVLSQYIYTEAHNWAHDRMYLGMYYRNEHGDWDSINALVRWEEAIATSNWLSLMEGLTPVYLRESGGEPVLSPDHTIELISGPETTVKFHPFYIDWDADGYRLPTEAEWEFVARGGNESQGYRFSGSDTLSDVITNFGGIDEWEMQYIPGQVMPNELGIHDMSSQASEWVLGPWTKYGELEPAHNPGRILRFDFAQPFNLILKGGALWDGTRNAPWLYVRGDSFMPKWRSGFSPDPEQRQVGGDRHSVRLVRKGEEGNYE